MRPTSSAFTSFYQHHAHRHLDDLVVRYCVSHCTALDAAKEQKYKRCSFFGLLAATSAFILYTVSRSVTSKFGFVSETVEFPWD